MVTVFDLANDLVSALYGITTEEDIARENLSESQSVEALDDLLRKAQALVGGLLNRHRPHHRLPAEILSRIFLLVSTRYDWGFDDSYPVWGPRFPGGQPLALVPLTAVCQRWRSILLGTPLLWSTVVDDGDDHAPSFANYIHRCTHGPLYVRMYAQPHSITRDLLAYHSERVQDLSVTDYQGDELGLPDAIASFRANELQRFRRFSTTDMPRGCEPYQLESSPYLPRNHFTTLTHLILECPPVASFAFQDLQTFLSGCLALQVLYLTTASMSDMQPPSASPAPRGSLHFKHLRSLSVVDITSHSVFFNSDLYSGLEPTTADIARRGALPKALLSSVVFPPQCLLYTSPLPSADIQALTDRMSTLITPSSMRVVDTKQGYIAPDELRHISFVLVQPSESRGMRYDVPFREYYLEEAETITQDVRHTIATSPLFSAVRELWADTGSMDFLYGRDSILRSLPSLEYLSLSCSSEENRALDEVLKVLSEVHGDSLVCPQLDTLVLITPISVHPLVARVRNTLVVRKDSGNPLKHLALYYVDIEEVRREVLEAARGLGDLVEHFFLNDNEDGPESEWRRFWDERVPEGCGVADEIRDYWPAWAERGDPADRCRQQELDKQRAEYDD